MSWQDTLSSTLILLDKPRKNTEIKYVFFYIYILDSALRDSAFLIARTFGRVPHKSSDEVFQICTKVYYCPSRPSELFIETDDN